MMMKVFCMFDNKIDVFNKPMFLKDESELKDMMEFANEQAEINPIEYEIYELGEYDTGSGKFELLEAPKHLYSMKSLVGEK